MVLQPVLEPSSEPLPLEDLILWQAFMEMNYQAPTKQVTTQIISLKYGWKKSETESFSRLVVSNSITPWTVA